MMFHVKLHRELMPEPLELEALKRYENFLRDRAIPLGLIDEADRDRLWERHIQDSLRARACLIASDRLIADIGSGAGLPGIPLAIMEPARSFVLIERRQRRAAILEIAVELLGLSNVAVAAKSSVEVVLRADLAITRAVGDLASSWAVADPLLKPGGRLLYFAGRTWSPPPAWGTAGGLDALCRVCSAPEFPWQGPLVIMSREGGSTDAGEESSNG